MAKLEIFSKQKTKADGKTKFRAYWTKMNIIVKGEEEKGKQIKNVNVCFRRDVKCANGVDERKIRRGIIYGTFDAPFVYEVTKGEDGKTKFPTIWIRSIDKFIEKTATHDQSDFIVSDEEESTEDTDF